MNNIPNNPRRPSDTANRAARQVNNTQKTSPQGTAQRPQGAAQRPQGEAQRPQGAAQRPQGTPQRPQGAAQRPPQKPQGTAQKPQGVKTPPKKGGKKSNNKDRILMLIMLILVVILAAIIIIFLVKAVADTVSKDKTTGTTVTTVGTTGSTVPTDPVYTTPVAGAWNEGFTTVDRANTAIHEGDLIVVNYMHEYKFPSSINLIEMYGKPGHNSDYVLGNGMTYDPDDPTDDKSLELSRHIVTNLTTMLADMKAANPTLTETRRLMILSGYRTYEKQQALYEAETVEGLTAKPGHSEHHTGLTFDIRISVKGQSEIEYLNDAEQAWIVENSAKYGFILRYTDDNKDITGILNEDWHFRYVGIAHATYMVEHDLCLEEYIDFLRENHKYGEDKPLEYAANGTEYTIYYFPASVENDVTKIFVPSSGYEISGDNINGFIVTVTNTNK